MCLRSVINLLLVSISSLKSSVWKHETGRLFFIAAVASKFLFKVTRDLLEYAIKSLCYHACFQDMHSDFLVLQYFTHIDLSNYICAINHQNTFYLQHMILVFNASSSFHSICGVYMINLNLLGSFKTDSKIAKICYFFFVFWLVWVKTAILNQVGFLDICLEVIRVALQDWLFTFSER